MIYRTNDGPLLKSNGYEPEQDRYGAAESVFLYIASICTNDQFTHIIYHKYANTHYRVVWKRSIYCNILYNTYYYS